MRYCRNSGKCSNWVSERYGKSGKERREGVNWTAGMHADFLLPPRIPPSSDPLSLYRDNECCHGQKTCSTAEGSSKERETLSKESGSNLELNSKEELRSFLA